MVGKYQWGFPAVNAHGKENGLQELVQNDTPITKDSKLNCWEGVLQAGMESGVLPKDKLVNWLIDNEAMDIDFTYTEKITELFGMSESQPLSDTVAERGIFCFFMATHILLSLQAATLCCIYPTTVCLNRNLLQRLWIQ
ncbi:hypothetical protein [uncultured Endozoicomonas sp.]|uniref:hypothetical protein n=1 Tax=uncultured Endozoicomonas sp. TaxID=432652 RepID=UPI002634BD56|nr:hypothetical protein [uncultured Endozoicomonas sp.]